MDFLLFLGFFSAAIGMRWIVARYPYSGYQKPPMFGDFEAQRHWMEITYHLPIEEWYQNSTRNNLTYWGLDYPLLTAYHSWLCGWAANQINPSWCALNESHGIQDENHKLFMRTTVFLGDLFVFYPSVVYFFYNDQLNQNGQIKKLTVLLTFLFYPLLVLIDHGHFQYNSISLGFALISFVGATRQKSILLSAFFFTLALNYKQMELYHAVPIFVYLLSSYCFQDRRFNFKTFFLLGAVVLTTFFCIWFPVLLHDPIAVLKRLFPFERGLYEDKVANFWCTLNLFVKLRTKFEHQTLAKICLLTTTLSFLPSSFLLFRRSSVRSFYLSLFNVSLCFYLFSFQVHEKTILLPCLPMIMLSGVYPAEALGFLQMAMISIFPLMVKDNLVFIFWITFLAFFLFILQRFYIHLNQLSKISATFFIFCFFSSLLLLIGSHWVAAPTRYPDLWPVLINGFCSVYFLLVLLQFHFYQWREFRSSSTSKKTK